jgi:hypothetical protein
VGTGSKIYTSRVKQSLADGKSVAQIVQEIAHPIEDEETESIYDF